VIEANSITKLYRREKALKESLVKEKYGMDLEELGTEESGE
jgi:hypothetical protein